MNLETLFLAIREIRRSLLRSTLTTLGVIIGVASVVLLVTLGESASLMVLKDIEALGSNLLTVTPGQDRRGPGAVRSESRLFKLRTFDELNDGLEGLARVAPASTKRIQVVAGSRNRATSVTGTTGDFLAARTWDLALGREFSDLEQRSGRAVCLLGETVRRELLPDQDPIGLRVRVGSLSCEVIGCLAPKGQSTFGQDQDDVVLIPLATMHRRVSGNQDIGMFYVTAIQEDGDLGQGQMSLQARIEGLLRPSRRIAPGDPDDFSVRDMAEIKSTMSVVTGVLTALLGAIAGVSLIVGGIGIMNIMLVSVTERTREIGIRLAIGALERDVMWQFLTESMVLSCLGGVIGIAIGFASSLALTHFMDLPFQPNLVMALLAFAFSACAGIGFGYLPARKAARLDPIEALRHGG